MGRLISTSLRMVAPHPEEQWTKKHLVYRLTDASEVDDGWERRIIELGDGKSIREIIEILYREEIQMGAYQVDIGLWRGIFDQSVVKTISNLTNGRHIYLKLNDGS